MISVFEYEDYKKFVHARISEMPKRGRGEFQRLAVALQMHSTSISQVFRGDKDLNGEQAVKLAAYWGLNDPESDYLLTLVERARAGTIELKRILSLRLEKMRAQTRELKNRIPKDVVLGEHDRYRFYSQWYYSAIRLICDIPEYSRVDAIAQKLNLDLETVNEALHFLIACGLVKSERGALRMGPKRTFIDARSSLIRNHHSNWRLRALESHRTMNHEKDFALTSPMTLSVKDSAKIKDLLLKTTDEILKINTASPSEELRLLNIDWLSV